MLIQITSENVKVTMTEESDLRNAPAATSTSLVTSNNTKKFGLKQGLPSDKFFIPRTQKTERPALVANLEKKRN